MLVTILQKGRIEAGCDEAGRGCLAGPVFAAAVILPADFHHPLLNDSKQMSEKQRYLLREVIVEQSVAWKVESLSAQEIDRINILRASFQSMCNAVKGLSTSPQVLLVDGNRFYSSLDIPYECIVKGDGKVASIAAASVLAKTFRDDFMKAAHREYPHYGWDNNKGYPTRQHQLAIEKHGLSPYHRRTFGCCAQQLSLFE